MSFKPTSRTRILLLKLVMYLARRLIGSKTGAVVEIGKVIHLYSYMPTAQYIQELRAVGMSSTQPINPITEILDVNSLN